MMTNAEKQIVLELLLTRYGSIGLPDPFYKGKLEEIEKKVEILSHQNLELVDWARNIAAYLLEGYMSSETKPLPGEKFPDWKTRMGTVFSEDSDSEESSWYKEDPDSEESSWYKDSRKIILNLTPFQVWAFKAWIEDAATAAVLDNCKEWLWDDHSTSVAKEVQKAAGKWIQSLREEKEILFP